MCPSETSQPLTLLSATSCVTSLVMHPAIMQICYMTPCSGRQKCDKALRDDVLALCNANDDRSPGSIANKTCALLMAHHLVCTASLYSRTSVCRPLH